MYRLVDCNTWNDPWFEGLEPQGKLFFLYLITNPRSTSCGAFEISERKMAFETGLPLKQIQAWLRAWTPRVMWWPEHNIVWMRNFYRRQGNTNEKTRINAERIVAGLPLPVQIEIGMEYPALVPSIDSLSIPDAIGMHQTNIGNKNIGNSEQEREGESEGDDGADAPTKPKAATAMTPGWQPTGDLREWAYEQAFTEQDVNREIPKFVDHHLNGTAKKDWAAAFRLWMRRSREFVPARTNGTGPPGDTLDPDYAAWLRVVEVIDYRAKYDAFPEQKPTRAIYVAVKSLGGWDVIDPANGFQRRDFLAAHKAERLGAKPS